VTFDAHEDVMRRYLLSDVTPEEQAFVEDRIAESADFAEALAALEEELIVQHLQGKLPVGARARFDDAFLSSEAGRRRVEEVAAFRDLVSGLEAAPANAAAPVDAPSRGAVIPGWAWAIAALVVLAVGGFLLLSRPRAIAPAAAGVSRTPVMVTLQLAPGLTRSESRNDNVFSIAAGTDLVELILDAGDGGGSASLRASLRRVSEAPLPITTTPARAGRTVSLVIPATTLAPGDYILTLMTGPQDETVTTRQFTILR
jgi:hypothetical protein